MGVWYQYLNSNRVTPLYLLYGLEAIIHLELDIPILHISLQELIDNKTT